MSKDTINLVSFEDVSLSFSKKEILKNISFEMNRNEIMTIIGPNGAGKSSILKLLIGQIKPSSGSIIKKENMKIGYTPQKVKIEKELPITVVEFINKSQEILNYLDLHEIKDAFLSDLSGGELQKVLLGRALIRKPDLLLLDESYQGLDVSGLIKFYDLVDKINQEIGASILMISHDLNIVMNRTDEVICLNRHICCKGLPKNISNNKEFIDLFGASNLIGLYHHNHDHQHSRKGDVI